MDWPAKAENERRNFQIQRAKGLMSLDELRNCLGELNSKRRQLQDRLQAAELEKEAQIVLSFYAGRLANVQALELSERQDVNRWLKLQIKISPYQDGGLVEIDEDLAANFVPSQLEMQGSP